MVNIQDKNILMNFLESKCCLNLSLDECPGIATYESMFLDVPVIGSPQYPSIFDQRFWVHDTDYMTEDKYLKRKETAGQAYVNKLQEFLSGKLQIEKNTQRLHFAARRIRKV